jgi:hypothetical protein
MIFTEKFSGIKPYPNTRTRKATFCVADYLSLTKIYRKLKQKYIES